MPSFRVSDNSNHERGRTGLSGLNTRVTGQCIQLDKRQKRAEEKKEDRIWIHRNTIDRGSDPTSDRRDTYVPIGIGIFFLVAFMVLGHLMESSGHRCGHSLRIARITRIVMARIGLQQLGLFDTIVADLSTPSVEKVTLSTPFFWMTTTQTPQARDYWAWSNSNFPSRWS